MENSASKESLADDLPEADVLDVNIPSLDHDIKATAVDIINSSDIVTTPDLGNSTELSK